jgi:hypothetical protein
VHGKNKIVRIIWVVRENKTVEAKKSIVGNRTIVDKDLLRYARVKRLKYNFKRQTTNTSKE